MADWNRIRVAPVVLATLFSLSVLCKTSEAVAGRTIVQDEETLEWLDDYGEAVALAKQTGQPIFLEFRCGP